MTDSSWAAVVRMVHERARNCCEYCRTRRDVIAQTMHVDHIIPAEGDQPDNLCLACPNCNLAKGSATTGVDPATGQTVALFHPRHQLWRDHFRWIEDGVSLEGITPAGRATVNRLKINRIELITARRLWIAAGLHPPE